MFVDIIIPAHNPTEFISSTIESCLNQTYKKFKIFVIDDASDSPLDYLLNKFPMINLINSRSNLGPGGARNLGIEAGSESAARGGLISFIDSDDIMMPKKLELSVNKFLENPNLGMTCGNYQIVYKKRTMRPFYKRSIDINHNTLMRQNYVASGSVTLRRDVFYDVGRFNEDYWIAEDYDLWLRVSEKYDIGYIHEPLYHYFIDPGSNSLTSRADIQKDHLLNLDKIKKASLERINGSRDKKN